MTKLKIQSSLERFGTEQDRTKDFTDIGKLI